jgi:DNA-binding HxlR family transcriptional regulator
MIDESAGVLGRKDATFTSSMQSLVAAKLLHCGTIRNLHSKITPAPTRTIAALIRRNLVVEERRPIEGDRWGSDYRLTDVGRAAAEASPAVREWIEGWEWEARRAIKLAEYLETLNRRISAIEER